MSYSLTLKEKIKIITSILGLVLCVSTIALLIVVSSVKNGTKEKLIYREAGKIDNCIIYEVKYSYTATNFVMKCN